MKKTKPNINNLNLTNNEDLIQSSPNVSPRLRLFGPTPEFIHSKRLFGSEYHQNDYELVKNLGTINGGFCSYERSKSLNLMIFKKVYEISQDTSQRYSMLKDLQVFYDFNSEFIVGFFNVSNIDDQIIVVYEYLDIGSCEDVLYQKAGRFPEKITFYILRYIVKGLLYLKEQHDLFHNNLKPSNILFSSRGEIRLTDMRTGNSLVEFLSSRVISKKIYLSPSRLMGENPTISSDIWSLGIILVEMHTGSYPYPITLNIEDYLVAFSPDPKINNEDQETAYKCGKLLPSIDSSKLNKERTLFSLIDDIINGMLPQIPSDCVSKFLHEIIAKCLKKSNVERIDLEDIDALLSNYKDAGDDDTHKTCFVNYLINIIK